MNHLKIFSRAGLFSLLVPVACVTNLKSQLQDQLQTWHGQSPDHLVELWGAPQSSYLMENGKKVLTYQDTALFSRSLNYGPFMRPEYYSYSDSCRINFYTDTTQKKLESTSFSGSPHVCLDMMETMRQQQSSPRP